ncbi:MAG: Si-specific NAD(P)(+) transhydrogenase [Anaerolineales bacterium]|jgi:NAD(P) transhydrogenase|nr:Si-specific NAD(P)(+) transhydrogenase [Anaerolineales bacterium]
MTAHYDLVVIGSGPAGEKGAAQAAYFGKKVALVERAPRLGGTSLSRGIPSKALRETALYFSGLRQRGLYSIDYSLKDELTVSDLMYREHEVVKNAEEVLQRNLDMHEIEVVRGNASLKDPHTVRVTQGNGTDRYLETDIVLIATGARAFRPADIPFDNHLIHDSSTIFGIDRIPKTMVVVGGGVLGTEFASIFTALGIQVTLIDIRDRLVPFVDREITGRLQTHLESMGMKFRFNVGVAKVEARNQHVDVTLQDGECLAFELALIAAGTQSNVEGMGLEEAGVQLDPRGLIQVNENYQTNVPNIYAAGDVVGFPALASTSMEQARTAVAHAFNFQYPGSNVHIVPIAIYSVPEIAMSGMTEEECKQKNIFYLVGRAYYEKNPRGLIIGDRSGMVKLVFSPYDKKLLGVHHIGEMASELIHIGAQVLFQGGTIDDFRERIYNYPTLSDLYKYAAYDGIGLWRQWLREQDRSRDRT